jgi:hypothetical protein
MVFMYIPPPDSAAVFIHRFRHAAARQPFGFIENIAKADMNSSLLSWSDEWLSSLCEQVVGVSAAAPTPSGKQPSLPPSPAKNTNTRERA